MGLSGIQPHSCPNGRVLPIQCCFILKAHALAHRIEKQDALDLMFLIREYRRALRSFVVRAKLDRLVLRNEACCHVNLVKALKGIGIDVFPVGSLNETERLGGKALEGYVNIENAIACMRGN